MNPLNSKNRLGESTGIAEIETNEAMNGKKTRWFLRWPADILRPLGRLAYKTISLGSAILQPVRRRLNQWN